MRNRIRTSPFVDYFFHEKFQAPKMDVLNFVFGYFGGQVSP